ncbi:MAG: ATP synthase F1 subunit epsilon [Magnetospirillum sp. WYHS-4]
MAEKIQFEIVTPAKLMLSEEADMVVAPGGDGDFGVLPGHAPMLSTLRAGTIDVYTGDKVRNKIFVEGGFAEVTGERCTILAQVAIPLREIGREDAERRLSKARDGLESADNFEKRKAAGRELESAEAMLAAVAAYQDKLRAGH